ncbi:DUF2530 domain-containing protein [Nocardioides sp. ChNu-153]|uniref:DUF2530 domain-containing protein n=1 Tax=Nocardioides sp. ChNu-153 TaxID=2779364 RepID=UPI002658D5D0|nr:DUF2530 domain-containing protein [Nocardioides sp. ChNu-153]
MELRDDQPTQHEIGRRTYAVADVEPLDVDGVRTVEIGCVLWAVAFVGLLPFYSRLSAEGAGWVLWTCLTGLGLGLLGLEYCRRRRRARTEAAEAAGVGETGDPLGPGAGPAA